MALEETDDVEEDMGADQDEHMEDDNAEVQPEQINMAVPFWYLVKSDTGHWKGHSLQGTRNTRPCLTGHPVLLFLSFCLYFLFSLFIFVRTIPDYKK